MVSDKTKIKKTIEMADFLDESAKKEWFTILSSASANELLQIEDFFAKAKNAQNNFKFKLINKANFEKEYKKKIKKLSDDYVKIAIKKSEKGEKEESPENILKQLDNL
jgi:hypothetical protein